MRDIQTKKEISENNKYVVGLVDDVALPTRYKKELENIFSQMVKAAWTYGWGIDEAQMTKCLKVEERTRNEEQFIRFEI